MATKSFRDMSNEEMLHLMNTCDSKAAIMKSVGIKNPRALNTRLSLMDPIGLTKFQNKKNPSYQRIPIDDLAIIVKNAKTLTEILEKFGYDYTQGATGKSLIDYLVKTKIDLGHLNLPSLKPKLNVASSFLPTVKIPLNRKPDPELLLSSESVNTTDTTYSDSTSSNTGKSNDMITFDQSLYLKLIKDISVSLLRHSHYMSNLQRLPLPLPINILQEICASLNYSEPLLADNISPLELAFETQRITKQNNKRPLSELLAENIKYNRVQLKERLIECGYLVNICSICSMEPIWNGLPIEFEMDHINGINSDNRIENLRLLCGNCHRQTPTYGSKNLAYQKMMNDQSVSKINLCVSCGIAGTACGMYCSDCTHYWSKEDRPTLKTLIDAIVMTSYDNTARIYEVTPETIKRWIKSNGCIAQSGYYLSVIRQLKQKYGTQFTKVIVPILKPTLPPKVKKNITIDATNKQVGRGSNTCKTCKKTNIYGNYCSACIGPAQRVCERPPIDQLMKEIVSSNYLAVGKKYNVSDTTIRKWIINYGFEPPTVQELWKHRKSQGKDEDFQLTKLEIQD
jgi:hypothetical protein